MKSLQYDGLVTIAVGNSRRSVSWQNRELYWSELAARLAIPQRTQESQSEYMAKSPKARSEIKDVGGFVGGLLKGGRRKATAITQRRLLTLDLDSVPANEDPWTTVSLILGCAAVLYSTHSHTKKNPRLRLVMPLSRPVTPDEYTAISRRIAGDIGIDMCDDTTYEPHRLMYWPSVSYDADFRYELQDGPWLDADEQLKRYVDWRDPTQWPVSSRKTDIMTRLAKKQGDPTEKHGIVGAFCRVYDIDSAIEEFLPSVYKPCGENRYTYTEGSTDGGLVVYEHGKFAYSHHGTDPISGKLCNAFDLVRLHMFADMDDDVKEGTPVVKYPSFVAMSEMAVEIPEVKSDLAMARLKEIQDNFDDDDEHINVEDYEDLVSKLDVSSKGVIKDTIDNAFIILTNDPQLKGKYYYDEFRERPIVEGDLPWQKMCDRTTELWVDTDDSGLRQYFEKNFGLCSAPKIKDATELAMLEYKRHPVRDYLEGLIWDGEERADTLFIKYLGASDSEYTRAVTRKALIGAVARIYKPGCKHDHMLVLIGPQGCRKSTTLAKLGKRWFSDSLYTVNGKDAYEQLQGYWLIEMGEMAATRKAELEQIKQFLSKQTDSYRAAYARRTQEHPRQCAFFGTTNDDEFMRDSTGGRRFWPVMVTNKGREMSAQLTSEVVDQIWAEIVGYYKAGEQWHLSDEMEAIARQVQAKHTEMNGKQGLIESFLDILLPAGWEEYDLDRRLLFFTDSFGEKDVGTEKRKAVCALEIWQELFRGDPKNFTQAQAREINGILRRLPGWESKSSVHCGKPYGRQRAFIRKDA